MILLQLLHEQIINCILRFNNFDVNNFHFSRFFSRFIFLFLLFAQIVDGKCFTAWNPALIHRLFRQCRMILFKLSLVCATACEASSSDFQSARYIPPLPVPVARFSVAIATAKRPVNRPEQMTMRGDWRWQHSTSDNGHFAWRKINSFTSKTDG